MEKLQRTNHFSETEVKLYIGDWLTKSGFQVFDEKPNKERPQWGVFEVRNINRGKRLDLVVRGNLRAAHTLKQDVYVAIEIKRGYKHHDILNGFDAILDYFSDYLWGAEYRIDNKPIQMLRSSFQRSPASKVFFSKRKGNLNHMVLFEVLGTPIR